MAQLNTGVTNIIAIDNIKKQTFYEKREEGLKSIKQQTVVEPIATPPVQQEQTVVAPISQTQPIIEEQPVFQNQMQTVEPTNADILSQSFGTDEIANNNINDQNVKSTPAHEVDFTEIVYDIAKIQDDLDKVIAKIITMKPKETKVQNNDVPITMTEPVQASQQEITNNNINVMPNEPIITEQTPVNTQAQPVQPTEISPFVPSTGNIFDQPQVPNM